MTTNLEQLNRRKKLTDLLGVPETATDQEVNTAFRIRMDGYGTKIQAGYAALHEAIDIAHAASADLRKGKGGPNVPKLHDSLFTQLDSLEKARADLGQTQTEMGQLWTVSQNELGHTSDLAGAIGGRRTVDIRNLDRLREVHKMRASTKRAG